MSTKRINNFLGRYSYLWILLLLSISSCQKVIDINLNSASPQIVVQGNLSNLVGRDTVQLQQTVNFSDPNTFPPLTGALVMVNDNVGNTDTLPESPSGIYTTPKIMGTPGRTYTLTILANGKTYVANSTMPSPVSIDALMIQKSLFGHRLEVSVVFKDPAGIVNYYRFLAVINHTEKEPGYVIDDELEDGQTITFPLYNDQDSVRAGDSVTVIMESIDKGTYQYYVSLENAGGGGGSNLAPSNPTSTLSNGALGYFSAYSVTSKSIKVQ